MAFVEAGSKFWSQYNAVSDLSTFQDTHKITAWKLEVGNQEPETNANATSVFDPCAA